MSMSVWPATCRLLSRYLSGGIRVDHLLEKLPPQLSTVDRRRSRNLLYGAVRHLGLLDAVISEHVAKRPKPLLRAILLLGGFEILKNRDAAPAIVHHAVDQAGKLASRREARLVNAVLRKFPETLAGFLNDPNPSVGGLARRLSHPEWLVARWIATFGADATERLLGWNQRPGDVFARVTSDCGDETLPEFFHPTEWTGFFRLDRPDWQAVEALLAAGKIYLQNPATSIGPRMLQARSGETVLDLCAAPGGKTLQLAERVGTTGCVIAGDLGGPRLKRLEQNAARYPNLNITPAILDLNIPLAAQLDPLGLPTEFSAVLIDVPCSNTGVLQHRVDVKWRLQPGDIIELAGTQLRMLENAASVVARGGRIVYSTCSLEPEENAGVVDKFLQQAHGGFDLDENFENRPWEAKCDGAGAFRVRRN